MKQAYPPGDDSSCHEAMNEAEEHCGKGHRRIGYGKIQLVGAPAQQLKRKDTQGNSREHPADKLVINIKSLISPDHQRDGDENTVSQSQQNERHQEEFVVFQGVLLWFRHVDLRISQTLEIQLAEEVGSGPAMMRERSVHRIEDTAPTSVAGAVIGGGAAPAP
jgi:hypothetical protein